MSRRSTGPGLHGLQEGKLRQAAGFSPRASVPYHYLFGCPQQLANFEDGVNFTGPGEEWPEGVHFRHDAAHCPDVNGGAVVGRPQEHFWSPVPGAPKRNCLLVLLQVRS